MSDWRDRFEGVASDGVPFAVSMRIAVPRQTASFLERHAQSMGMDRTAWIRVAISEQLIREGVEVVPDMKPYTGKHLRLEVSSA